MRRWSCSGRGAVIFAGLMDVRLAHLSLLHFRNHRRHVWTWAPGELPGWGQTGGKTNLLDAVHHLSLCKSYFDPSDQHAVLHGEDLFLVKGRMRGPDGEDELLCSVRKGIPEGLQPEPQGVRTPGRPRGRYPVVMIAFYDAQLVLDGVTCAGASWTGSSPSSTGPTWRPWCGTTGHWRSGTCCSASMDGDWTAPWWNPGTSSSCSRESRFRRSHRLHGGTGAPARRALPGHQQRSGGGGLSYRSTWRSAPCANSWTRPGTRTDRPGTTVGVHRDDLLFSLDRRPLKRFGSQGPAEDLPHRAEAGSVRPDGQAQRQQSPSCCWTTSSTRSTPSACATCCACSATTASVRC